MNPMIGSALIGAGSSLLGGFMSGRKGPSWSQQEQLSREFAQKGIQWKVEDAKRAGIHPLYALGAVSPSAPQFIPGQSPMGDAVKDAGATISRALDPAAKAAVNESKARTDLLKAQTRAANAQTAALMGPQPPPYAGVTPTPPGTPKALQSPLGGVTPGPDASAEVMEEEYGGAVGEVHGVSRYARDRAYREIAGQRHPYKTDYPDPIRYHSRKYRSRSGRNARNAGRWRY